MGDRLPTHFLITKEKGCEMNALADVWVGAEF